MSGRIIVFGATGYTGRRAAEALAARDERPLLAGRSSQRLRPLAERLGGLDYAVADVGSAGSVRSLAEPGDVLVSTVGPFARFGIPALEAAVDAGAWYLDSTGEPPFIRSVFERFGPRAAAAGTGLVTAFGYDFVPGNLAGALALREAGDRATRVDIGYYVTGLAGNLGRAVSRGTRASMTGTLLEPMYAWRRGIRTERGGTRVRSFSVAGREQPGLSIGASEHFALPRLHSGLAEVNVYLGWFGPATRALAGLSRATPLLARVPGMRAGLRALTERPSATGGSEPTPEALAALESHAVAIAYDKSGERLGEVRLAGSDPYEFTANLLAWGAVRARDAGGLRDVGALGPAEAFGVDELERGCAEAGIRRC